MGRERVFSPIDIPFTDVSSRHPDYPVGTAFSRSRPGSLARLMRGSRVVTDESELQRETACCRARQILLDSRSSSVGTNGKANPSPGIWEGELSSSALSTATALMALHQCRMARQPTKETAGLFRRSRADDTEKTGPSNKATGYGPQTNSSAPESHDPEEGVTTELIERGVRWLCETQNEDGGWGDTLLSLSNISTTMLVHASLVTVASGRHRDIVARAAMYVRLRGGVEAVKKRYGKDHTFSVPIMTHCALAGLVDWNDIPALPFELAVLPHRFFQTIQLPVVSYALPALIAIGQMLHARKRTKNPWWFVRRAAIPRTLRKLAEIQPTSGGFLEATPLTSFVTMCLAALGHADHPVARKGRQFLVDSVRPDGSWPIDTNLTTWVTTLSVNALGRETFSQDERVAMCRWLLEQQYRDVHPYTNAAPGGWAWTNLSGGVPDADDTPGAILALLELAPEDETVRQAVMAGVGWLLDLQNRDGGWPTFCRGWGVLPFDRSSPDISAHALRALLAAKRHGLRGNRPEGTLDTAIDRGFAFLKGRQRLDGSWLPLWFGNQHAPDDENPTYGTSKVLLAFLAAGEADEGPSRAGMFWLVDAQRDEGSWGAGRSTPGSIEETGLALHALARLAAARRRHPAWAHRDLEDWARLDAAIARGTAWLATAIHSSREPAASPIGFYFAKLWYYERLYPQIFAVEGLTAANEYLQSLP